MFSVKTTSHEFCLNVTHVMASMWISSIFNGRAMARGYIQMELMTCCLSRKCQNSVLFQENIQFLCLCFGG